MPMQQSQPQTSVSAQQSQSQNSTSVQQNQLPQIKTVYINFVDGITLEKVNTIMTKCNQIMNQVQAETLYFSISSSGGSVDAGIALYHFLKALPCKIVMHNIGSIDSIANVVFMAGHRRYAVRQASFLLHGVTFNLPQAIQMNSAQLKEFQAQMDTMHEKIAEIIAENSNLTKTTLEDLFRQGDAKGTTFAKENKIIHGIRKFKIPLNAPLITIGNP